MLSFFSFSFSLSFSTSLLRMSLKKISFTKTT
jgi:hypothetical protein